MRLRVLFFGGLQRVAGCREAELELNDSTTPDVNLLTEQLLKTYPEIKPHLDSVAFAVGDELVDRKRILREGEQVGLLPPVSGG